MKKRLMVGLLAGGLMAAMLPGVASADKPEVFTPDPVSFMAVNSCTELEHEVTINFVYYDHVGHKNNFVSHGKRTGSTDDGYMLVSGNEHVSEGPNGVSYRFKDVWRNPDTGSKFQAAFKLRMRGNAPVVEEFVGGCVGAPTLPQ